MYCGRWLLAVVGGCKGFKGIKGILAENHSLLTKKIGSAKRAEPTKRFTHAEI